ncbi:Peptidase M15B [uncultured Caudovirales phage]|uniref:Peptidase M15B n=1 Tax=uncultured Caudovirales phage TaxID=2100421 RepID=A0A6J5LFE9_9CAUD|nr:Peptidase M15B [uncultured Caudovirales phage]
MAVILGNTGLSIDEKRVLDAAAKAAPEIPQVPASVGRIADEAKFSADNAVAAATSDGMESDSQRNILHNFVNFTYLLTMHMMTKDDLAALTKNSAKPSGPTVIIASGGVMADPKFRCAGWSENFFIEDLSMDTIIGLNAQARGSNAVKLAFKIIEPNGVSLIERLLATTASMKYVNFKDVIYVMQVDFTGYNSEGTPVSVKGHTKYIPFCITGIGFKITERGAEYNVSGVPFNHQALTMTKLTAPMNMSIVASTVSEYFTDSSILDSNTPSASSEGRAEETAEKKSKSENSTSFMAAINRFEQQKVATTEHQEVADIYNVIFDKEIGDSLLITDASQESIASTPLYPDGEERQAASNMEKRPPIKDGDDNLDKFFSFGDRSGSKESFLKLDPKLQARMLAFAKQWYSTQLKKIFITSAFRTAADQQRIREASLKPGAKYPAAQPGKSLHERGLAVDIDSQQANKAEKLGYLAANGLFRPWPDKDPVHIIMSDTKAPAAPPLSTLSNVPTAPINVQPAKKGQIKYNESVTAINSGTILIDEINKVIRNSSYMHGQIMSGEDGGTPTAKPMRWWKIIPVVELLDYDHKRQTHGKKITYYVKPYNVYSSAIPGTPRADPDVSRTYDYLFTGKNQDIKDFNLEFNTQFYLALSVNIDNWKATSMSADASADTAAPAASETKDKNATNSDKTASSLGSVQITPVTNNMAATAGAENKRDVKSRLAGDVQEMLLNHRGGDMCTLSMTILGDPAFIKQDDIFSGPSNDGKLLNGSLPTDDGEVYIKVEFKTPLDTGTETGLMTGADTGNVRSSKFGGLFRLLKVESVFSKGEFIQKIEGVRIFTDTAHNPVSNKQAAAAR